MSEQMGAQVPQQVDTLITGATIFTMNAERQVIRDGALAFKNGRIEAVGKTADITSTYVGESKIDGRSFLITPGFVDGHIHITGDPLTAGVVRGAPGEGFVDVLTKWVIPIFHAHNAQDEKVSAQFAALRMLRSGVTSFVEAGTVSHLDAVVEGLNAVGVGGRVGAWVEGRSFDETKSGAAAIDEAIKTLENEVQNYRQADDARVAAWPLLIGHTIHPDEVWRAAKQLADENNLGVSAHMSPYNTDPQWFLENTGRRPIEHLEKIGVLGENVMLTHCAYVDDAEVEILAETGTSVVFCPYAALKGAFGATAIGKYPEMAEAGVKLMLGTDGVAVDILRSGGLMTGLFKDARVDENLFPAAEVFEMITVNGHGKVSAGSESGSIEPGRKATISCFDLDRPEWFPAFDLLEQMFNAAGRAGAHSVWVDGERVLDNYRSTRIDEEELFANARATGARVIERAGVPVQHAWPEV